VAPIVDLLVRLSLAKAFFAPGMLPGGDIGDFHATWPIIAARVTGPVLLAAGFLVRPLALLMLVLTLLAQSLGVPQDEHLLWAALFGWYVVQGAGPLSLDHVLGKGLAHSPLPLAGPAMATLRWVSREVGPFYLFAIRLWLAAALIGPVTTHAMLPTMEAGMLLHPIFAIDEPMHRQAPKAPSFGILKPIGPGWNRPGPQSHAVSTQPGWKPEVRSAWSQPLRRATRSPRRRVFSLCPADRCETRPRIKGIGRLAPGDNGFGHLLKLLPRRPTLRQCQFSEHAAQPYQVVLRDPACLLNRAGRRSHFRDQIA